MSDKPVSTTRLREIARAITLGPDGRHELSMRVPAEPERDADLVISAAAAEIDRLRAELAEANAKLAASESDNARLREAATRASAELRHAYPQIENRGIADGLIGRAIKLLERADLGGKAGGG